jgi:hypothetical protein
MKHYWPQRKYRYKDRCPLATECHTRYLTLLPAKESNDPLRCILDSTTLADCPPFEAVSYVWGNHEKVSKISCHGRAIPISFSLDAVLRGLCQPDEEWTLWVDAICINQADPVEQSHQVAMMAQIYAAAKETIIHLGPDLESHANLVASLLTEVTKRIEDQGGSLVDFRFIHDLAPHDQLSIDPRWQPYRDMLYHKWFSRVWTVQESALGGNPYILWGSTKIPWLQVIGTNQWLLSKAPHIWCHSTPWLNDVHGRGFWTAEFPTPNFVEVLTRAKTLECTDNRDRIYAFLGSPKALVGERKQAVLVPDYEKSYREVYRDFAASWLTKTQDLTLLSAVEHTQDTLHDDMPSWVPRWNRTLSITHFGLCNSGFNAAKHLPANGPVLVNIKELTVTGSIFDTIVWRSESLPKTWDYHVPGFDGFGINPLLIFTWTRFSSTLSIMSFIKVLGGPTYANNVDSLHPDEATFALDLCRQTLIYRDKSETELRQMAEGGDAMSFARHGEVWAAQRSVALTWNGRCALVPAVTAVHDHCYIVAGMPVPVILRPQAESDDRYQFLGESVVLGIMHGELFDKERAKGMFDDGRKEGMDILLL